MGDRVNAMRDYQEAIKLDATYSLAYFNAANVYFHMRQFKQARAYYSVALQFNANDESALVNRAITKVTKSFEFCGICSYLYYWFSLIEIKWSNSI